MKYCFEFFLLKDQVAKEDWNRLYNVFSQYVGVLREFQLIVKVEENTIRYFLMSDRDLGSLSNNIEVGVLRPVKRESIGLPAVSSAGKERMVIMKAGGNLLDLKEKYKVKKAKELNLQLLNVAVSTSKKPLRTPTCTFRMLVKIGLLTTRSLQRSRRSF